MCGRMQCMAGVHSRVCYSEPLQFTSSVPQQVHSRCADAPQQGAACVSPGSMHVTPQQPRKELRSQLQ